jgi:hypothetical protein
MMLKLNPEERINFPEIISILHSFFYNYKENSEFKSKLIKNFNKNNKEII